MPFIVPVITVSPGEKVLIEHVTDEDSKPFYTLDTISDPLPSGLSVNAEHGWIQGQVAPGATPGQSVIVLSKQQLLLVTVAAP